MRSKIDISNDALTELGANHIQSFNDGTPEAIECSFQYDFSRTTLLAAHVWGFAAKRVILNPLQEDDPFGMDTVYMLPRDYLRLAERDEYYLTDFRFSREGDRIYTSIEDNLRLRYVRDVENVAIMDNPFKKALSLYMAWNMCEALTQSNTKKDAADRKFQKQLALAKKVSSIEKEPQRLPDGPWITDRV